MTAVLRSSLYALYQAVLTPVFAVLALLSMGVQAINMPRGESE